jgi:hypothetical protein
VKKSDKVIGVGLLSLGLFGILTAEACSSESAPAADSDSAQAWGGDTKVPVDEKVYHVTGEVVGQINNLTRQVEPAKGSLSGSQYGTYGTISGSFTGPVEAGKGFVRLRVTVSDADIAPVSEVAILKTSDSKVTALQPGDVITFSCRKQYEALAPVLDNQDFQKAKNAVATWELDYCRLAQPVIQVK